ncbi:MAG: FmdB family zinc ribbon protein, partial [Caldimicrobium sp.]
MPIYEFQCEECGTIFEKLMKRDEDFPPCPNCNSTEVVKMPSLFGFQDKVTYRTKRKEAILRRV